MQKKERIDWRETTPEVVSEDAPFVLIRAPELLMQSEALEYVAWLYREHGLEVVSLNSTTTSKEPRIICKRVS